jgi:hypothetical protein
MVFQRASTHKICPKFRTNAAFIAMFICKCGYSDEKMDFHHYLLYREEVNFENPDSSCVMGSAEKNFCSLK